jgi:hypothetical protein
LREVVHFEAARCRFPEVDGDESEREGVGALEVRDQEAHRWRLQYANPAM